MSNVNLKAGRTIESELARVIEPLASYICASDQPRAALMSAVAVLFSEVKETHRAAIMHVAGFSENSW